MRQSGTIQYLVVSFGLHSIPCFLYSVFVYDEERWENRVVLPNGWISGSHAVCTL